MEMKINEKGIEIKAEGLLEEQTKIIFEAGKIAAWQQLIRELVKIAVEEYKIDVRYAEDFSMSIRDTREVIERLKNE